MNKKAVTKGNMSKREQLTNMRQIVVVEGVYARNQGINAGSCLWLEGTSSGGKDRGQSSKSTYVQEKLRGITNKDDIVNIKESDKNGMEGSYVRMENSKKCGTKVIVEDVVDYENARGVCMEEREIIELTGEKEPNITTPNKLHKEEDKNNTATANSTLMKSSNSTWTRKARSVNGGKTKTSIATKRKIPETTIAETNGASKNNGKKEKYVTVETNSEKTARTKI